MTGMISTKASVQAAVEYLVRHGRLELKDSSAQGVSDYAAVYHDVHIGCVDSHWRDVAVSYVERTYVRGYGKKR